MEYIDFKFDRKLTNEEFNFWSSFFDNIPYHHNAYIQSIVNSLVMDNKKFEELSCIFKTSTKKELLETISSFSWNDTAKQNFIKIIDSYQSFIPNAKPKDLFILSIFSAHIQDLNLELFKDGINLTVKTDKNIRSLTFVPELALISDLMAGRINDIISNLNINPVSISGQTIVRDYQKREYSIVIESKYENTYFTSNFNGSLVSRNIFDSNIQNIDTPIKYVRNLNNDEDVFGFTYSINSDNENNIAAPLGFNQSHILKLIHLNYLENNLTSKNEMKKNRKI